MLLDASGREFPHPEPEAVGKNYEAVGRTVPVQSQFVGVGIRRMGCDVGNECWRSNRGVANAFA